MIQKIIAALGVTFALACGAGVVTPTANAAARFETGDAGYVKADETVDGTAYMAGNSERIEGTVNGDVYCAGNDLLINGTVNGDVICAGMSITVNGKVTGDVRVAGNSVTIGAEIGGSLTAFGATVTVETAATVAKDATIAGSTVLVNGSVGRDIVAGGSSVTLNGSVGRNVEGEYQALTIGKDATVGGYVHYASATDAAISGNVAGEVTRSEPSDYNGKYAGAASAGIGLASAAAIAVAWTVVTAVALMLVLPKKMMTATNLTPRNALLATLLGFFALFAVPTMAVLAMITVVAIPVAIALLLAWIALIIVSFGISAIYLGRLITQKRNSHPLLSALIGGIVLGFLLLVPIIDLIVIIIGVSFGTGAVLYAVRGEYEGGTRKPKVKLAKD